MKISGNRFLSTSGKFAQVFMALAFSFAGVSNSFGALRHNYLFNSGDGATVVDSVAGGLNGTAVGGTIDTADSRYVLDGVDNYVNFDGAALAINTYSALTLELWSLVSPVHEGQYTASVAFGGTDAGGAGINYIMMQPTRGGAEGSSGQIIDVGGGGESRVNTMQDLSDGRIHHTVLTISATEVAYYVDGVSIGTAPLDAPSLSGVSTQRALLGDSVWDGDPFLNGALYEFRVYDDVKSPTDVANLFNAGCQAGCGNLYLEVNRSTGAATLFNGLSTKDVIIYQVGSAKGALNGNNWLSVTNNYDQDNGGEFDMDDQWEIVSQTNTLLREQDPIGQGAEDGGAFNNNATVALGNIWTKSPFEDLQVTMTILDANLLEQQLTVPVFFVGNNDTPFSRSDFDLDGDIDTTDYLTLKANHLANLGGTLHIDTFALGDINGDLLNDYRDFRVFKADFIAANGAGAFASMIANYGAVPEPSTLGLLLLAGTAGALTRRKRVKWSQRQSFSQCRSILENCCTMDRACKTLIPIVLLMLIPVVSHAQVVVGSQDFDALTPGPLPASGLPGARFFTCCTATAGSELGDVVSPGVAGAGNMVRASHEHNAGGFSLGGFGFDMPISGNISPNRSDYRLEFDMRLVSGQPFTGPMDFFITIVDTPVFGGAQAHGSVYNFTGVDSLVVGGDFQHISMGLGTPTGLFFNRPVNWLPVDPNGNPSISLEFNSQGVPTAEMGTFTQVYEIDNVQLVLDIATSLAMVVDPTNGKARIRNESDADVIFDYYRVESTNGSLLTSNYNGTTGWNSLDDQGINAIGAGIGESWDEVTAASSANRLVEQFLLGQTTLGPGQSVSLGAPINPTILNNQLNSLAFRFGGPSYEGEGLGQVIFEALPTLVGDYNDNGVVDAADYTIWRDRLGQAGSALPNRDPANSGSISAADYNSWKARFGQSLGSGAAGSNAVPEPSIGMLCSLAICVVAAVRRPRRSDTV